MQSEFNNSKDVNNSVVICWGQQTHSKSIGGSNNWTGAVITLPYTYKNYYLPANTGKNQNMNCITNRLSTSTISFTYRCVNNSDSGTSTGCYYITIGI